MVRGLLLSLVTVHMLSVAEVGVASPTKLQALRAVVAAKDISWLRSLPRKALSVGAAALIACSAATMTGCERGRSVLNVTDTEYADPSDENAGQYVTFHIDNVQYEGYWEVTPDGQLLIEVDDGYDKLVLLEHMTGQRVRNHRDLEAEVVVYGKRNGYDVDKYGTVVEVYDNGFYIIEIDEVVYVHNDVSIDTRETLLVNAGVLPEDGGFEFLDD